MKLLIIGAGAITRNHIEGIRQGSLNNTPVEISVAEISEKAREAFKNDFPEIPCYASAEELLALPVAETDIVLVATPPVPRFALAKMAMESGRHVLCEKPLCSTSEEAFEMLRISKATGKQFGDCSTRFVSSSAVLSLAKEIEAGTIGTLYHIIWRSQARRFRTGIEYQPQSRWFLKSALSGGGVLMDWGCYDLALIHRVIKPVKAEILGAWTSRPTTEIDPVLDFEIDVEHHFGTPIRYHLNDGTEVVLDFDRSSCFHGKDCALYEFQGLTGAFEFVWNFGNDSLIRRFDCKGELVEEPFPVKAPLPPVERAPIRLFKQFLETGSGDAIVGKESVFNYLVLNGIYQVVKTGKPLTISMDELK